MNPMNASSGVPALWQEARNPEGRVYYYNTQTKATQWTKPVELMTGVERALADQPWKEYTADGGRKYWYNTESKQSTWEMPEVYKNALAQAPPIA
jgi:pre-mRNA-processing factor 40